MRLTDILDFPFFRVDRPTLPRVAGAARAGEPGSYSLLAGTASDSLLFAASFDAERDFLESPPPALAAR